MAIRLFVAPAAAGKTQACLDRVRQAGPLGRVWVCLPNAAQVRAFRRRLAARGGALGPRVGTFRELYREILSLAGEPVAELVEPLQYRLLRAVVDRSAATGELVHYAPLRDRPGFVRALHELVRELGQAYIQPERLSSAVAGQGRRLEELAALYAAYEQWLEAEGWIDGEALGWRAIAALAREPRLCAAWELVVVDGFDHLERLQVALMAQLAPRVAELWVTLTYGPPAHRLAHRRFERTLAALQEGLGLQPEPLPGAGPGLSAPLRHLEARLFQPAADTVPPAGAVAWLEAPNPALEARAALRWVKQCLVDLAMGLGDVAVLARDLTPYAPFLQETAQEFGLPLHLAQGWPLAGNPGVAALRDLLALPRRDRASALVDDGRFPVRQVLQALRSPYFDWENCELAGEKLGLTAADVDHLEQAACAVQAVSGLQQWQEAFSLRLAQTVGGELLADLGEAEAAASELPPEAWAGLQARFARFVERVTPPAQDTVAGYTRFVEDLIGDDPETPNYSPDDDGSSLRTLARVRQGPPALVERDVAALHALKDALRGLVWADAALGHGEAVPYERFLDELEGVIAATTYEPAGPHPPDGVFVAGVPAARGLSLRAVALLGLSEGLFPAPPPADPLLSDSDRQWLAGQGLRLEPALAGADFTLFYEAVTRARERLLLTRPYLGPDGQPWEPSPFWEETLRLFGLHSPEGRASVVARVRSADSLPLEQAASWPELLAALSQRLRSADPQARALEAAVARRADTGPLWQGVHQGAQVLAARLAREPAGPHEGDCAACQAVWATLYAPRRPWSASRLESYLGCPFAFYLQSTLELAPRPEPVVGFDARQLGGMCHAILEEVYRHAPSGDLDELLAALPAVAERVLGQARAPTAFGLDPSGSKRRPASATTWSRRSALSPQPATAGSRCGWSWRSAAGATPSPPSGWRWRAAKGFSSAVSSTASIPMDRDGCG